jgi:hypothetical protein
VIEHLHGLTGHVAGVLRKPSKVLTLLREWNVPVDGIAFHLTMSEICSNVDVDALATMRTLGIHRVGANKMFLSHVHAVHIKVLEEGCATFGGKDRGGVEMIHQGHVRGVDEKLGLTHRASRVRRTPTLGSDVVAGGGFQRHHGMGDRHPCLFRGYVLFVNKVG